MEVIDLNKYYQGKKILITGHTGFKGSWLLIWLKMLGAKVVGISLDPKNKNDNFILSGLSEKITDYREDIRNKNQIESIFKKEQPEIVFHLAAQALVIDGYKNPVETYDINVMGTINILEAIRNTETVKQAIFITTDKVYENKEWIWPYREEDPLGGYDPYSASKGAAEIVIASYRNSFFNNHKEYQKHRKSIASVRAGNVIGGGDWSENRIIPDCIKAIESGNSIGIRNPLSIRPWQHVLEPLSGYLILGARMMDAPTEFNEAWNFGPEASNIVDVKTLVQLLIKTYRKGEWEDLSGRDTVHEAQLLSLDISKSKYKLGWIPVLDTESTIRFTVDWYKKYNKEDVYSLCVHQIEQFSQEWRSKKES